MNSTRHEGASSSPYISCLLYAIFIKTDCEIQSMFGSLLDFVSNFHNEKMRKKCIIHENIENIELYIEKFPAGHY